MAKKRLIVLMGAGASIPLKMPSVAGVDAFLSGLTEHATINGSNPAFDYFKDRLEKYYKRSPYPDIRKSANFEEVLYTIQFLATLASDTNFQIPLNPNLDIKNIREVFYKGSTYKKPAYGGLLLNYVADLHSELLTHFRVQIGISSCNHKAVWNNCKQFWNAIKSEFDVGVLNLNYDNTAIETTGSKFTGFSKGEFDSASISADESWDFTYHLHGSVHFNLVPRSTNLHTIVWKDDLTGVFHPVSSVGGSGMTTTEHLFSTIITGQEKLIQIQREPFISYYEDVGRRINGADAILIVGYGFNDPHINNFFKRFSAKISSVPCLVMDYADPKSPTNPLTFRHDAWSYNLFQTLSLDKSMQAGAPPDVQELIVNKEFETFTVGRKGSVSVWYNGFDLAWLNISKLLAKLR